MNFAESLRDPENVMRPDPRAGIGAVGSPSLPDHHARIASIALDAGVPEAVAIQFETARNLYLYAWYVYRFYMVSATQVLAALEFGLRERLPRRLPENYQRRGQKQPTLAGLLGYAIDRGLIRNEGFRRWHAAALACARDRRSHAAIEELIANGLHVVEVDETLPAHIKPEDQQWDLVAVLRQSLPPTRNTLAHGSSMLTWQVLGTIELVAEILNQVYTSGRHPTTDETGSGFITARANDADAL